MDNIEVSKFEEYFTNEKETALAISGPEINVQIKDEDGNIYPIKSMRYSPSLRSILIEFDHND